MQGIICRRMEDDLRYEIQNSEQQNDFVFENSAVHVREIGEIPLSEETPHSMRALARKSERPCHVDSIRLSIRRSVHKLHGAAFGRNIEVEVGKSTITWMECKKKELHRSLRENYKICCRDPGTSTKVACNCVPEYYVVVRSCHWQDIQLNM